MKLRIYLVFLLSLLCCAFVIGYSNRESSAVVLHDVAGNAMRASQLQGKWLVFTYWAPWCPICLREVDELNSFYQHNRDPNLLFFGVNFDHPAMDDLRASVLKMNIRFPVLLEDPASIWPLDVRDSVPVTFFVDPQGNVSKIDGANTEESLLAILNNLRRS